ncbi:hypothetical protein CS8_025250 [Cupriavidus sp. 8B]
MRRDGQRQRLFATAANGCQGRSMSRTAFFFAAGCLAILLVACGTPVVGTPQLLSFLQDGSTTREDVYLHLAEPSATFEAGRIHTYLLDEDQAGYILMHRSGKEWNGKYSLVLAFDEHGVLRRHSLVRIRSIPNSP